MDAGKIKVKLPAGPSPQLSIAVSFSNFLKDLQVRHKVYYDESKENSLVTFGMSSESQQSWLDKFSSAASTVLLLETDEYRVAQAHPADSYMVAAFK